MDIEHFIWKYLRRRIVGNKQIAFYNVYFISFLKKNSPNNHFNRSNQVNTLPRPTGKSMYCTQWGWYTVKSHTLHYHVDCKQMLSAERGTSVTNPISGWKKSKSMHIAHCQQAKKMLIYSNVGQRCRQ